MQTSRILITGRNKNFPKVVNLPYGYGAFGTVLTRPVEVRHDECVCRRCGGHGTIEVSDCNPSSRPVSEACPDCDEGIAKVAA